MARQARIVIPGAPHHITQRGNRGEPVFFEKDDLQAYIDILVEQCEWHNVAIWAYCLMQNQIHFIAVPKTEHGLGRAIGEAHRRYTRRINDRQDWRGHLFQDRYYSYAMDREQLLKAARFIETLPVAAGVAASADAYLWSSARAHLKGREDKLLSIGPKPSLSSVPDWGAFLKALPTEAERRTIQTHLQTGRPLGADAFLDQVERDVGRPVRPQKPGRKRAGTRYL